MGKNNMRIIEGIGIIENAFDDDYCAKLIDIFSCSDKKYSGRTYEGLDKSLKDTTEVAIMKNGKSTVESFDEKIYCNRLNECLVMYLNDYTKEIDKNSYDFMTLFHMKTAYDYIKIQKYKKGEGHYHTLHQERDGVTIGFHRIFVLMLYLNAITEGGETVFPLQSTKVIPKPGTLVVWPAGFPYLHRGLMPISDDKYIVTAWLEMGDFTDMAKNWRNPYEK